MPLVCIQCALEAYALGRDLPMPTDETNAEHMARCHPNGVDPADRARLERLAAERMIREGHKPQG